MADEVLGARHWIYASRPGMANAPISDTIVGTDARGAAGYAGALDEEYLGMSTEARNARRVRVDSYYSLGTYAVSERGHGSHWVRRNVTMVASYQSGGMTLEPRAASLSLHYGFSRCLAFGRCAIHSNRSAAEYIGSLCHGGRGICYESAEGQVECGTTIATYPRSATGAPINTANAPRRCPRGSPVLHGGATGTVVHTIRLPFAGCLVPTDAQYEPSADVHVPQLCAVPAPFFPGCLFPGALNYQPDARQSSFCRYATPGCTSATAVNFNSRATHDDGSCVEAIAGCTLKPSASQRDVFSPLMTNASAAAPMGRPGELGLESPALNYLDFATVLSGCVLRIEGCTDSSAANYDPDATLNTRTWCVPSVRGCMMPGSGSGVARSSIGRMVDFGGSATYNAAATVHVPSMCRLERHGCTTPSAINFDAHATVNDGSCYARVYGCLDRAAVNFGCAGWEGDAARCAAAVAARAAPPVTIHEPMYCRAAGEASRPTTTVATLPPLRSWETLRSVLIRLRVVCDAELSAFDELRRSDMQSTIAATASVPSDTVQLRFGAASMVIDATITVSSVPAAALVYGALAPAVASASAASAWLFPGGESAVLGMPLLTAEYGQIDVAPEELPASVAAILGLIVLLAVAFLSWFFVSKRRRNRTKSVDVVDGDDGAHDGAWTAPPSITRKYAPFQIVPIASDGTPLDLPLGHVHGSEGVYRSPRILPLASEIRSEIHSRSSRILPLVLPIRTAQAMATPASAAAALRPPERQLPKGSAAGAAPVAVAPSAKPKGATRPVPPASELDLLVAESLFKVVAEGSARIPIESMKEYLRQRGDVREEVLGSLDAELDIDDNGDIDLDEWKRGWAIMQAAAMHTAEESTRCLPEAVEARPELPPVLTPVRELMGLVGILRLSSSSEADKGKALHQLALLANGSYGDDAIALCEGLRATGGVELIVGLLGSPTAEVHRMALMLVADDL